MSFNNYILAPQHPHLPASEAILFDSYKRSSACNGFTWIFAGLTYSTMSFGWSPCILRCVVVVVVVSADSFVVVEIIGSGSAPPPPPPRLRLSPTPPPPSSLAFSSLVVEFNEIVSENYNNLFFFKKINTEQNLEYIQC